MAASSLASYAVFWSEDCRMAKRWDNLSDVHDKYSTVFVGRLPTALDMGAFAAFLSSAGRVKHIAHSGTSTYMFCEYGSPEEASNAVRLLNGASIVRNRIVVKLASQLTRLFVGNLTRTIDARSLHASIAEIAADELVSVELFELSGPEAADLIAHEPYSFEHSGQAGSPAMQVSKGRSGGLVYTAVHGHGPGMATQERQAARPLLHRGFCFVEFTTHAAAHRTLLAMLDRSFAVRLYSISGEGIDAQTHPVKADWAEPLQAVSDEIMDQVMALYVSNLPPLFTDASERMLADLFASVLPPGSAGVERVKRMKNFAFIHFFCRQDAEQALGMLQNHVIAGHAIKIEWSKPPLHQPGANGYASPMAREYGNTYSRGGMYEADMYNHRSRQGWEGSPYGPPRGQFLGRGDHSYGKGPYGAAQDHLHQNQYVSSPQGYASLPYPHPAHGAALVLNGPAATLEREMWSAQPHMQSPDSRGPSWPQGYGSYQSKGGAQYGQSGSFPPPLQRTGGASMSSSVSSTVSDPVWYLDSRIGYPDSRRTSGGLPPVRNARTLSGSSADRLLVTSTRIERVQSGGARQLSGDVPDSSHQAQFSGSSSSAGHREIGYSRILRQAGLSGDGETLPWQYPAHSGDNTVLAGLLPSV